MANDRRGMRGNSNPNGFNNPIVFLNNLKRSTLSPDELISKDLDPRISNQFQPGDAARLDPNFNLVMQTPSDKTNLVTANSVSNNPAITDLILANLDPAQKTVNSVSDVIPDTPAPVATPQNTNLLNSLDISALNTDLDFESGFNEAIQERFGFNPEQQQFTTQIGSTDLKDFRDSTLFNDRLRTGAQVLGAVGGAVQAYTGLQQLDLARDSFRFNRSLARANLGNQTRLANLQIRDRNAMRRGKGLSSRTDDQAVADVGLQGTV